MAEILRGVSQRLSDGERTWEAEKHSLEGHTNRTQHSLREAQATADQLRYTLPKARQASEGFAIGQYAILQCVLMLDAIVQSMKDFLSWLHQ